MDEKVRRGIENYGSKVSNPGDVDEAKWEKAKKIVREEYGFGEESDRFWRTVQGIYQKMVS